MQRLKSRSNHDRGATGFRVLADDLHGLFHHSVDAKTIFVVCVSPGAVQARGFCSRFSNF